MPLPSCATRAHISTRVSRSGFHNTIDIRGVEGNVARTPVVHGDENGGGSGKNVGKVQVPKGYSKARRRMVFKMGARQHLPL